MSWIFFPQRRISKKASETTRSRNESVKSLSTTTFTVLCLDALSERKNVQVVSVTTRNRDERCSQPNPYPNTRRTAAVRRSRKPRSRFLQESAHPEVSTSISPSIVTLIQIHAQHNLYQSGGKLLTFDFCTPKSSEDDKELRIRNWPNSFSVRSFLFSENIFLMFLSFFMIK